MVSAAMLPLVYEDYREAVNLNATVPSQSAKYCSPGHYPGTLMVPIVAQRMRKPIEGV